MWGRYREANKILFYIKFFKNPRFLIFSYTGNRTRFPDPLHCSIPSQTQTKKEKHLTRKEVFFFFVGLPGIEPGLYAPEAHVLPVYYSPSSLARPAFHQNYGGQARRRTPIHLILYYFLCPPHLKKEARRQSVATGGLSDLGFFRPSS